MFSIFTFLNYYLHHNIFYKTYCLLLFQRCRQKSQILYNFSYTSLYLLEFPFIHFPSSITHKILKYLFLLLLFMQLTDCTEHIFEKWLYIEHLCTISTHPEQIVDKFKDGRFMSVPIYGLFNRKKASF